MGENLYSDVRSALLTQPYDYCVYRISWRLAENYNIHAKSPLITMSKGAKIYLNTTQQCILQVGANGLFFVLEDLQSWEMRCIVFAISWLESLHCCLFLWSFVYCSNHQSTGCIYIYLYLLLFCLTLVVYYRKAWLIPQYWLLIDKRKLGLLQTIRIHKKPSSVVLLWKSLIKLGGARARVLIVFPISGGSIISGAEKTRGLTTRSEIDLVLSGRTEQEKTFKTTSLADVFIINTDAQAIVVSSS